MTARERPEEAGNEPTGRRIETGYEAEPSSTNALAALKRVKQKRGGPGVDGMTVGELSTYLGTHWDGIREQLLAGTYQPQPVRRHDIPKPGGGTRRLGIPTVLDRFIQQCLLQVLQPQFDPTFSEHSHGFRPGRSAHDAVRSAHRHIQSGLRWVADVDLAKFFDRVNHDVPMERLSRRLADRRVLGPIRRYLVAGVLADGVTVERHEGTPQGGPLSPLLANVLLDDVDKALERRGLQFARHADDLNVYTRALAAHARRWWAMAAHGGTQTALPTFVLRPTRRTPPRRPLNHRTAGCGPACPVVWEGKRGANPRSPIQFGHRLLGDDASVHHHAARDALPRGAPQADEVHAGVEAGVGAERDHMASCSQCADVAAHHQPPGDVVHLERGG